MGNNSPKSSDSVRPTGTNTTTAPSSPLARTAPEARADGGRIGAESGTPSSNTVPDNSIPPPPQLLRWGVDSLYLSYQGELIPEVLTRLNTLKKLAQSEDDREKALAQYPLNGHIFEVKDKGTRRFPFILEDGVFRIQLSKGQKLPVAYVKISARFLSEVGPSEAEKQLYALLEQLAQLSEGARVSRIDLFCDFAWSGSAEWGRDYWVTRASAIDTYSEDNLFTGWVIGKGGLMMARLYLKSLQAKKVGAEYLFGLWREAGWNGIDPVWRLEFEFKRAVLAQMSITRLPDVLAHLNGLWSYAMTDWLKLAIPQPTDKTRSRWPIHPLWADLASVDWETPGGPLLRQHKATREPADSRLFSMYLGALVSFMAKRGIQDLYQGQEDMVAAVVAYYSDIACNLRGQSFDDYIAERLALKHRQFNTNLNAPDGLADIDQTDLDARAGNYRKATGG